jgi:uncharacterized protein (TIGR00730 family)
MKITNKHILFLFIVLVVILKFVYNRKPITPALQCSKQKDTKLIVSDNAGELTYISESSKDAKNKTKRKLTVFLGSRSGNNESYKVSTSIVGNGINKDKYQLLYGGTTEGLMGVLVESWLQSGGNVTAHSTKMFESFEPTPRKEGMELIVHDNINLRQRSLVDNGEIFVALQGGIGTLSELLWILVKNYTTEFDPPRELLVLNTDDYFMDVPELLCRMDTDGFLRNKDSFNIRFFKDPTQLVDYLNEDDVQIRESKYPKVVDFCNIKRQ